MDENSEALRFKGMLVAGVLFLFSAYFSYQELRYAIWGQSAEARITSISPYRSTRGLRRRTRQAVRYSFVDEQGQTRDERDDVRSTWQPSGETVTVAYIPGVADASRLASNTRWYAVWLFLICVAWLAYQFVAVIREANRPIASSRPKAVRATRPRTR